MKKKCLSLILAAVLYLGMAAGCKSGDKSSAASSGTQIADTASQDSGPLFSKPVNISMMIRSNPSWPFQKDWYVKKLIKDEANVDLEVTAVPEEGYQSKANVMFASGKLPDLIWCIGNDLARQYGPQGALVDVLKHADEMPNFKKWYGANTDYALNFLSADGALYQMPEQGADESNRQGWLYRKDVFDKLKIPVPTNQDEFYNALKKLKEAYPKSYPFVFRDALEVKMSLMAPSWGSDYPDAVDGRMMRYDYDAGKWFFGPTNDGYKEMLQFYNKLYKEGLMMPNVLSIDTKGWQDAISNNDSFVTLDYLSRIGFFNTAMRQTNPDFTMAYMDSPSFGTNGVNKIAYSAKDILGFVVSNQSKHLDEVLKYLDWMYSDKAVDLLSWGREGETYKTENGGRKWIDYTTAADVKKGTGFETDGFYQIFNFDAEFATFGDEIKTAVKQSRASDMKRQPVLSYTQDEMEIYDTAGTSILNYVAEETSKFILGERGFDTWDDYVKHINDLGLDQLKKIHEDSYTRIEQVKAKAGK